MDKEEDEPYINEDLLNAFSPEKKSVPIHKKEQIHAINKQAIRQNPVVHKSSKRKKGEKIYWSIPALIFVAILALGIRDDPADSGSHEILLTIFTAGLIALFLLVLFGIPFLINRKMHNRKRTSTTRDEVDKLNLTSKRYKPNEASKKKKWIYTILLLAISPFTVFISLLFIPFIWSSRFSISRGGTSKLTTKKVKEPHYIRNAVIICVVIVGFILYKPITDRVALYNYNSNASEPIKDIANRSGFNNTGRLLFYKSHPELVNADTITTKCPVEDQTTIEYGCYIPSENKMYILEVVDSNYKDVEYTTAAHETLHAAYVKLNETDRQTVIILINEFYNDKTNAAAVQLQETVKLYGSDKYVIDNELHSFIGSETAERSLSQSLVNYYNKYFSDRSVSVNANVSFNSRIDNKISSLRAEYSRLDRLSADIDNYRVQWLDTIQSYMRRNLYYGDISTYNKNVVAYNSNFKIYNKKIENYNANRDAYNNEVNKFNVIYRAFYPTKAQLKTK